jgi:hypothetical protein
MFRREGSGSGFGKPIWVGGWNADDILSAAQYSPQIALAKARSIPFAPYVLNITNTFNDSTTLVSQPQSFQGGQQRLDQASVVDRVMFQIDAPQAFAGTELKSLSDFFYGEQSGIQATMEVQGAPRYAVAPFFTPLRTLCAMFNEAWPFGWCLSETQTISMQFQQVIPVPFPPTTVTVSFRLWQPLGTEFVGMTAGQARAALAQMGFPTDNSMAPTPSQQPR